VIFQLRNQHPARPALSPKAYCGLQDLRLDQASATGLQGANRGDIGAIFIAQWQMKQQIPLRLYAQLMQLLCNFGAYPF